MLLIDNDCVARVLTMRDCIDVQERAFAGLPGGASIGRPRIDTYVPTQRDDSYYRFGSVDGATDGILAVRLKSDVMVWPRDADGRAGSEQKYCVEPGTYCGLVMLFSTENGKPLAMLNDGHLQHMRVGGAAGLGTRLLAREDAHTVGMIGSGGMAETFLEALVAVREIRRVRVFSRREANRLRFARDMAAKLGIEVEAVGSAEEAVRGADIVATCTDSMTPVIDADWLEPGMHVVALTPREFDTSVANRFDVCIAQGRERLPMEESERFSQRVSGSPNAFIGGSGEERARLPVSRGERVDTTGWPVYTDVITGRAPGRTDARQITFYYTVGNWGVQFAAVGGHVYREAARLGLGIALPEHYFLQSIRN
ncbi:ornithine cyclodeaminase family protein [Paraburkholderia phytofirmans]|jgi:alanine dehydrogenase|uniref:ornithine cyclodeaminase family protein n=1 Tax=Paraburkholderia sp. BL9I2N2 TaxID=1938809 RepID=UPI0010471B3E|nr:ornithine cyclodeaminase family protein [Paraburkholderia sp. BL9I2N2]TCK91868.1 alanine dehydrogenase [Paraburkholderia sp. BL9I2N2]